MLVVFLPLLRGFSFSISLSVLKHLLFVPRFGLFLHFVSGFLPFFLILSAGFKEVYIHGSRRKAGPEPYLSAEDVVCVCVTPDFFIFFQKRFAPQKSNIDTKNGHIFKESTFSKPSFWVSMLVVGCVRFLSFLQQKIPFQNGCDRK